MNMIIFFITGNWDRLIPILISGIALFISWKAWIKNRAIYQIETTTVRQVRGRSDDAVHDESINRVNKKLKTGKFTILNISTREADGDYQIFLGRIK